MVTQQENMVNEIINKKYIIINKKSIFYFYISLFVCYIFLKNKLELFFIQDIYKYIYKRIYIMYKIIDV